MNYEIKRVPPHTNTINGMIDNESMTLRKAVGELVANSLDQDARNIHLAFDQNNKIVTIVDDGNGPPEGLEKLIEIGCHIPSRRDPVGKFGVGHKEATCWIANLSDVQAMTATGAKESMKVNWELILKAEDWIFSFSPDSIRTKPGLSIKLTELRGRRLQRWDLVPRYVAELFGAAIEDGVVITVDGEPVKSLPVPELEHRIEFESEMDGLRFRGFAGILKDKGACASGWDIRYRAQSLASGYSKEGFGKLNSQGFYGRFEMLSGTRAWQVSKNKTDSEDLYDVLNGEYMQKTVIQPLMSRLKDRGETLKIILNKKLATNVLTSLFERIKATRDPLEEEDFPTPDPNGDQIGPAYPRGPRKEPNPNPAPGPRPRPQTPSVVSRRARNKWNEASKTRDLVRQAESISLDWHVAPHIYGTYHLKEQDRGRQLVILIDRSPGLGEKIWAEPGLILHYAVMCLATHAGTQSSVWEMLKLSKAGSSDDLPEVRVSKNMAFLLENVDADQLFSTNGVKP